MDSYVLGLAVAAREPARLVLRGAVTPDPAGLDEHARRRFRVCRLALGDQGVDLPEQRHIDRRAPATLGPRHRLHLVPVPVVVHVGFSLWLGIAQTPAAGAGKRTSARRSGMRLARLAGERPGPTVTLNGPTCLQVAQYGDRRPP